MKHCLFALCSALLLTSCAGVRVEHTDVASGATKPKSIYIRPFVVTSTDYRGWHHSVGERPIRRSLAPAEFAEILKEEVEQIAPAMVLRNDEVPPHSGWLIEGEFDIVDSGSPLFRAAPGNLVGIGASRVLLHVRIIDAGAEAAAVESKDKDSEAVHKTVATSRGAVLYEFDVTGGSRVTGKFGSITAPGLGYAVPFDFRNAAERICEAVTPDPHRFGLRTSPTIR